MKDAVKSIPQILKENICTVFNALNLMIAIALAAVGAYKNMAFIAIIVINTIVGIVQQIKARNQIEKLRLKSQPIARILNAGKEQPIPLSLVRKNDILVLNSGDIIPADATIRSGKIEVNEAILSGESDSVMKTSGDSLLAGSTVIAGKA
jgi:cation-transporting ATPase E